MSTDAPGRCALGGRQWSLLVPRVCSETSASHVRGGVQARVQGFLGTWWGWKWWTDERNQSNMDASFKAGLHIPHQMERNKEILFTENTLIYVGLVGFFPNLSKKREATTTELTIWEFMLTAWKWIISHFVSTALVQYFHGQNPPLFQFLVPHERFMRQWNPANSVCVSLMCHQIVKKAKLNTCGFLPGCFMSSNKAVGGEHLHILQHNLTRQWAFGECAVVAGAIVFSFSGIPKPAVCMTNDCADFGRAGPFCWGKICRKGPVAEAPLTEPLPAWRVPVRLLCVSAGEGPWICPFALQLRQ